MQPRRHIRDELLVLRCQQGDTAAFEELVARWQERLWRHAWRLTGSEDAAWDALQEAWVAIARGIGRLDHPAALPAWAYRIVSNKSRDWTRREIRRRRSQQAFAEEAQRRTDDLAEAHERCAGLRAALARLPGDDRALLALHYQEGFDMVQIGRILAIPSGTVKSRLHRIRKQLREIMEGDDHE